MTADRSSPSVRRCRTVVVSSLAAAVLAALAAGGATSAATGSATASSHLVVLTNSLVAHWAPVVGAVDARRAPSAGAGVVAPVPMVTGENTQNILLLLARKNVGALTWYDVRLATLPNSQTGWVPASSLGNVYTVTTHLYVDRETFTATLKRSGRTIFTTRVGVGKSYWPTPKGEFYIRDKITNFGNPFYGPVAFGTSARSDVLTDWPGGGYVGVHGTNEPGILPGAVSHGCVRMVNSAILRLAQLMPVGTPLTVT